MNKELLLRVRDHIIAEPRRLTMGSWLRTSVDYRICDYGVNEEFLQDPPPCGTVGCIAGWTVILGGVKVFDFLAIPRIAEQLLGVDTEGLFYVEGWPQDLRDRYVRSASVAEKAAVTAERIDRFLSE